MAPPQHLYYSYAPEDEAAAKELGDHLSLLRREGLLSGWGRHCLEAGQVTDAEVAQRFGEAQVVLLLLSAAYAANDACYAELQAALAGHKEGRLIVRAIRWRPVDPGHPVLRQLPTVPASYDIATQATQAQVEQGWAEVADELRRLLDPAHTEPRRPGFDIDQYRRSMRSRYGHLNLGDLDATAADMRSLALTGMFIVPQVRECAEFAPHLFELPVELRRRLAQEAQEALAERMPLDAEAIERYRRSYYSQAQQSVLQVIDDVGMSRLVILGDPGGASRACCATWSCAGPRGPRQRPGERCCLFSSSCASTRASTTRVRCRASFSICTRGPRRAGTWIKPSSRSGCESAPAASCLTD